MSNTYRVHKVIDFHEIYSQLPEDEVVQQFKGRIVPDKTLSRLWAFTFQGLREDTSPEAQYEAAKAIDASYISHLASLLGTEIIYDLLYDYFSPLYFAVIHKARTGDPIPLAELVDSLYGRWEFHYTEPDGADVIKTVNRHHPLFLSAETYKENHDGSAHFGIRFHYYDWPMVDAEIFRELVNHHKNHWLKVNVTHIQESKPPKFAFGDINPIPSNTIEDHAPYQTELVREGFTTQVTVAWEDAEESFPFSISERFSPKILRVFRETRMMQYKRTGGGGRSRNWESMRTIMQNVHTALLEIIHQYDEEVHGHFAGAVDSKLRDKTFANYWKETWEKREGTRRLILENEMATPRENEEKEDEATRRTSLLDEAAFRAESRGITPEAFTKSFKLVELSEFIQNIADPLDRLIVQKHGVEGKTLKETADEIASETGERLHESTVSRRYEPYKGRLEEIELN